jgi:hypothetical protein
MRVSSSPFDLKFSGNVLARFSGTLAKKPLAAASRFACGWGFPVCSIHRLIENKIKKSSARNWTVMVRKLPVNIVESYEPHRF